MGRFVGVGLIGHGFMGRAHSLAWRNITLFTDSPLTPVLKAVAGRSEDALRGFAARFGFERYYTDYRLMIKDPGIDIIDNVTPNYMHAEPTIEAMEAGKHVIVEKPMAMNSREAYEMVRVAERTGVINMVAHNYRFVPAIVLARQLIGSGSLGRIYHFRALYLQQSLANPEAPMTWRLRREYAGYGTIADLGSHVIDLARYLIGEVISVNGTLYTFNRFRVNQATGVREEVNVDEGFTAILRFENGAFGLIEASKLATGHYNSLIIEVNGSEGSIRFDLERINELEVHLAKDGELSGFRRILVTQRTHPYLRFWWPPGHVLGWEHTFTHEVYHFLTRLAEGKDVAPEAANFRDGLRVMRIIEAIAESSERGTWVSVTD
ncbi:Gfo/Idh/MocA family protein [Caldivirga sp. MU80]|uniref:Gfo/Idh/MocA family protein n=1 Tax=Caldivirga sp. MU80 TaxID=1650354 RepID=UPI0008363E7D|nr:Gfo/Idh/MocA family oxidoreductase [Caldivirga sp. MU80]